MKIMNNLFIIFLCLFVITPPAYAKHKHLESWYQHAYCNGTTEYVLPDSARVDCLTNEYAIEFDFAQKWAECIGQALFYGEMTGKKPACFLIMEKPEDKKDLQRLKTVADKYNITVLKN